MAETEGHRQHRGLKDLDCLSCHGTSSHQVVAPEKTCTASCHKDERLHKPATADAETCLSCHTYAVSAKLVHQPTTIACEKCHAKEPETGPDAVAAGIKPLKQVNEHVLHGGVACNLCHNAHGKTPKPPPGQPVCARCHQFEIFEVGKEQRRGPEGHRNCEGCHKPHAPLKTALRSCVDCHEKNAKGLVPEMTSGRTTALKHESCASCHLPHSWKAERSGCMQCHEDKATLLLTKSPEKHDACTKCHEVHGAPPTGAVCLKCHSNTKGRHVALAPVKHKDCTSCHDPHQPKPEDTRTACAKCHTVQLAQVMRDGPEGHAKETCFGCHQPHENPLPPVNVCAKCHTDKGKAVAAADPPKHRICISCHQKHKFRIPEPKVACAQCHEPTVAAIDQGGPHQGDCKKCHTLHGSPGIPKSGCFGCHDKVQAQFKPPNETHGKCRSCHEPHRPAKTAIAKCGSCHEAKASVQASWPAGSPHQQACNGCHQQHDVRVKKPCQQCHEKEGASAQGGKHQCIQCHPPHNPPPGRGPAWWGRCQQCHGDKVESVKERGPKHSDCKNCHEPHRFAVPKCTQCHTDMGGKGLHAVPQHAAKCNACHNPHVKSEPVRAQCVACHTNRTTHQPDAEKCQACHMFQ